MATTMTMTDTTVSIHPRAAETQAVNYKPFYSAIRKYVNNKSTREGFICEYGIAQKEQGIRAARRRVI